VSSSDIVVEIGPGVGTLTRVLAEQAEMVIAIEIDKELIPILSEMLEDKENVKIIEGDALKLDLDKLVHDSTGINRSYKIVANLPYYITTPLVMHFLESGLNIDRIVIMVQKEVAERFAAQAGTKDYGALTVNVNFYAQTKIAFTVSRHVFIPKPDVDSAVVDLKIWNEPPFKVYNINTLKKLVKAAFNQRRKTLSNALKVLDIGGETIADVLKECGIDLKRRGETLTLEEFVRVANRLSQIH